MQDLRDRQKNALIYDASSKKLNTIHINPLNTNLYTTCGLDKTVRVFDFRSNKTEINLFSHRNSVNSAFWNYTGDSILSTSFDDTLSIWNPESGTQLSIDHNNNTGRWIQKFKAVFDSNSNIMVGNMKRGIDIFSKQGKQLAELKHETITAIPAVNIFHGDMIISGNASGKASVWK
jgi:WD40 repeat protein